MKDLKFIIKEEISDFDYLGIDEAEKDNNERNILSSKEFQTQFVNDILNDYKNKNKFKSVNTVYKHLSNDMGGFIDDEPLNIEYDVEIMYNYNGRDIGVTLFFDGDNIYYKFNSNNVYPTNDLPGDIDIELESIDWGDIKTNMFTSNGETINVDWLNKAKFYPDFVKQFIKPIIDNEI